MHDTHHDNDVRLQGLLDHLASLAKGDAAGSPPPSRPAPAPARGERIRSPMRDEELLGRPSGPTASSPEPSAESAEKFMPGAPRSLAEARLTETEVEAIVLRFLLLRGAVSGMDISQQVALPFGIVEKLLQTLKLQRFVIYKGPATLKDYVYELTEAGLQRARQAFDQCTYCGAAPVHLKDYAAGVAAQSLRKTRPRLEDLRRAFTDLTLSEEMFLRLGRAVMSGRGLFLYGRPGNGKTSIAERITAAYGTSVWIPRAISAWGEIIRLFDPSCHEEMPLAASDRIINEEKLDTRWVRIRRPTIVVGGELTMDNLDITVHKDTNICEAPVQLKSNCGTLVVDDFGRQRISPATLLNRWIVPLEKRYDYLGLASGRKIQVPFDQFTVFSTNLEPKDLVDEAFLRRIPYKIDVENPREGEFRRLFERTCREMNIGYSEPALEHLVTTHYRLAGREMRFCHPRDLLQQVAIYCTLLEIPPAISVEALNAAAKDYFSVV